jgi:hypothetical protein
MAVENIPWMIKGGKHSEGSGRRVLFHATGGAEGISSIGDLRVQQQAVATGTVKISTGSCVMVNRYPGAFNESYDGKNASETTIAIAPNGGGSTRYDLIIARIDDWNYAGQQATPDPLPTDTVPAFKFAVISGVAGTVKTAKQLNLAYPAIALARIAVPAATSAITQAMITDLREKAVPRRQRNVNAYSVVGATVDNLDAGAGEAFPNGAAFNVEVPEWATQARVTCTWYGVKIPSGSTRTGYLMLKIGAGRADVITTQASAFDNTGVANASRNTMGLADTRSIPATMRGQTVAIWPFGQPTGGAGGYISADALSSCVTDIEWLEAPTEDV